MRSPAVELHAPQAAREVRRRPALSDNGNTNHTNTPILMIDILRIVIILIVIIIIIIIIIIVRRPRTF